MTNQVKKKQTAKVPAPDQRGSSTSSSSANSTGIAPSAACNNHPQAQQQQQQQQSRASPAPMLLRHLHDSTGFADRLAQIQTANVNAAGKKSQGN